MKKSLLFLAVVCMAFAAVAAPTLTTVPYPAGPGVPTSATVTVDGVSQIVCTVAPDQSGAVAPSCDLAGLPVGTHSLVMTVTNSYGCTTGVDGNSATCVGGGSASSAPFTFVWSVAPATKPLLRFKP